MPVADTARPREFSDEFRRPRGVSTRHMREEDRQTCERSADDRRARWSVPERATRRPSAPSPTRYRRELQVHCYRILGSLQDAEDLVQETLLAAWRGLAGFEGRASVRAWLYRIATNRCLNALRDGARRPDVIDAAAWRNPPEPTRSGEPIWLQPFPDDLLDGLPDRADGPEARYETRRRSASRSSPACSACRPRSARCSCCATCSVTGRPRWPTMLDSTRGRRQQRAAAGAGGARRARPSAPAAARCPTAAPSAAARRASPTPSRAATSTPSSRSSPTTPGCACRPSRTSTRAARRSPRSCARARSGARAVARPAGPDARQRPARVRATTSATRTAGVARAGRHLRAHPRRRARSATITRFGDNGVLPYFGLPRTIPG